MGLKRVTSTNGRGNPFLEEHDHDYSEYTGFNELENSIQSLEATILMFKKDINGKLQASDLEKKLAEHAANFVNNARKYTNETRRFVDKTITTDELKDAMGNIENLLTELNKNPADYNLAQIDIYIEDCRKNSLALDKDIHKYNFKAALLMFAALAVTVLAITLLTTLTGIFIPISIIGITLTAELISKIVVGACLTSAMGFSLTGTWLFTRKNDIALSCSRVIKDANALRDAAKPT